VTGASSGSVYTLAYNNRGYVYEGQARKGEAFADFKSALLLDPALIGASALLMSCSLQSKLGSSGPSRWWRRVAGGEELCPVPCGWCNGRQS
jgi:hypothetical protein